MLERVPFHIMLQGEIGEHAAVGNAHKKEQLFKGQSQDGRAEQVVGVECPNPHFGENDIPHNEERSNGEVDAEEVLPLLVKLDVFVKAQQQRQGQTAQVHREVQTVEFVPHYPRLDWRLARMALRASAKYFHGTQSMPKHSPSSLLRCLWCTLWALRMAIKYTFSVRVKILNRW